MDISVALSRMFGLYFVIVAVAVLKDCKGFMNRIEEMIKNDGLMLFGGIISLLLGIILITVHNLWVLDWRVLITILAWLTFIKGVVYLLYPGLPEKFIGFYQNPKMFRVSMSISLVIGGYLLFQGFVMH